MLRRRGLLAALRAVGRRLLGRRSPHVIAIHPFDTTHHVETSGLIDGAKLPGGHPHDSFSTAYFGVPPSRFAAAMRRWAETPGISSVESYAFMDMGCGKGRALLLASSMGFRAVVGVELSAELAAIAERNVQAWGKAGLQISPVTVVCGDAVEAARDLPGGSLLVYLYNPFEAPVLRALLSALARQQKTRSAPVNVLYLFPAQDWVFREFPEFTHLWTEDIPLAPDEAVDGLSAPKDPCSLYRLQPRR